GEEEEGSGARVPKGMKIRVLALKGRAID
ncbi:hypothetical protein A2U01_0065588, partial [Trifolium medium]|nr:hypothetical protein [Trifolium medium]